MENRLTKLFQNKTENILSIYFTAGFPQINHTLEITEALAKAGADILEIGIPFSDPIADGPTIQESNQKALENGMTVELLLNQIKDLRKKVEIPVLLMGYLNPIMQYGMERFCKEIAKIGIDGLILPDLPMYVYEAEYKATFEHYNLSNIFLITPQTSDIRIKKIDELGQGFIYMVSTSSTTGRTDAISQNQENYFSRISQMNLKNPKLIGFGISDNESFSKACTYANGAIIGSAFIKHLANNKKSIQESVQDFVYKIKQPISITS